MPVTTESITIDSGGISLVGAISVPDGQGPHPAVVICHGLPAARPTPTADITLSAPTDEGLTYAEIAETLRPPRTRSRHLQLPGNRREWRQLSPARLGARP